MEEECVEYQDGRPLTMGSVGGGYGSEAWISERITHRGDRELVARVRDYLDDWRIYHFHDTGATSPLKKTAEVNDNRFLRHDGANLAAFLYCLSRKHADSYNLIVGGRRAGVRSRTAVPPRRWSAARVPAR